MAVEVSKLAYYHLGHLVSCYNIFTEQDGALKIRPCNFLKLTEHSPQIVGALNVLHHDAASTSDGVCHLHEGLGELGVANAVVHRAYVAVEAPLTVQSQFFAECVGHSVVTSDFNNCSDFFTVCELKMAFAHNLGVASLNCLFEFGRDSIWATICLHQL